MQQTRIDLGPGPAPIRPLLELMQRAGGRAWLVGGAVRDQLLGIEPHDHDIATDLHPELVQQALAVAPELRIDSRDAGFGACRVEHQGQHVTITTLRQESGYRDGRRPDEVAFVTDPAIDARRRDFTVNALYYEPRTQQLLDPCGGQADLEARRLRTIGDPAVRFGEDRLRLLRLVRFAAGLDFEIDAATARAASTHAAQLTKLAPERVFDELTRTFCGPGRGRALRLLVDLGLATHVLPEVPPMAGVPQPPEYHPEGCVLTHVCLVLEHVRPEDPVQAWSAVLHDVGKPATMRRAADRIRFDGHDQLSAQLAEGALQRLRAPQKLRQRVVDVCRDHIRFAALPQMRPVRAERWMRTPNFEDHLAFHRADCLGSHGQLAIYELVRDQLASLPPRSSPLLTGRDVLALGVSPGKRVGELLRQVEDTLAEGAMAPTREHALVLLRDLVAGGRQEAPRDTR